MKVRKAEIGDRTGLIRLRKALWPDVSTDLHGREIDAMFDQKERFTIFVASQNNGKPAGFIECSLREVPADGCEFILVGYIEGWYVEQRYREHGIGRALMEHAESWARGHGAREMHSDADPENTGSLKAHAALGYEEYDRAALLKKRFIR